MPCMDGGPTDHDFEAELKKIGQMLCGLCKRVENAGVRSLIQTDPALRAWWRSHKIEDERRIKREEQERKRELLKRSARAKLTGDEYRALVRPVLPRYETEEEED